MGVSPLYGGILMQASVFNSRTHGCVTTVWGDIDAGLSIQ